MQKLQLAVLLVGILLLGISGTYIFYETFMVLAEKTLDTDVVVREGAGGFNLNPDKLHFGDVPPGDASQRRIHLSYSIDSKVHISVKGQIAQFMNISEEYFFLPADERKDINLTVSIPDGTPVGNYTGRIFIEFLRP